MGLKFKFRSKKDKQKFVSKKRKEKKNSRKKEFFIKEDKGLWKFQ